MILRVAKASFRYLALATGMVVACQGQERWDALDFKTADIGGLRLYGVSVFSGYSSFSGPVSNAQQALDPAAANIGNDINYGAQWSAGWRRQKGKSSLSVSYNGTYSGRSKYTELNAFGHSLNLEFSRKLWNKWTFSLSASGDDRTFAQYLFQPQSTGLLAQLPGSASDLASSLSATQLTTNASGVADLLAADRVLFYQAQASATYAPTSRLSLNFSSFSAGGQQSFDKKQTIVMPRSLGAKAGLTLSYALSPRTNIGVNVDESRISTQFQSGYSTNGSLFFSRKMGVHWFLNLNGGMSYSRVTASGYAPPPTRQVIGGGSLGYRTRNHTFLFNHTRSSQDVYGTAAGLNALSMGSWNWRPPGSNWTVFSNVGQNQIRDAGFTSLTGWRATAGVSRNLSEQFSVNCEFSYLYNTGNYLGVATSRRANLARLSLRWHPLGNVHPRQAATDDTDTPDPDHQ
jgi:hypothetical protein